MDLPCSYLGVPDAHSSVDASYLIQIRYWSDHLRWTRNGSFRSHCPRLRQQLDASVRTSVLAQIEDRKASLHLPSFYESISYFPGEGKTKTHRHQIRFQRDREWTEEDAPLRDLRNAASRLSRRSPQNFQEQLEHSAFEIRPLILGNSCDWLHVRPCPL